MAGRREPRCRPFRIESFRIEERCGSDYPGGAPEREMGALPARLSTFRPHSERGCMSRSADNGRALPPFQHAGIHKPTSAAARCHGLAGISFLASMEAKKYLPGGRPGRYGGRTRHHAWGGRTNLRQAVRGRRLLPGCALGDGKIRHQMGLMGGKQHIV